MVYSLNKITQSNNFLKLSEFFKKSGWYTQFTKFYYPDDLYYGPNASDTELLKYLTAHKNDDYIEDLEVKGEQ